MKVFALTRESQILRLEMDSNGLEEQVCKLFYKQFEDFQKYSEKITFSAGNRNGITSDEVFVIENFEAASKFQEETQMLDSCGVYDPTIHTVDTISALFVKPEDDKNLFLFQYFDAKQRLSNEKFVIFSKSFESHQFCRLDGTGFVLDTKLVAVLDESDLYFKSFFFAKRVFDLGDYFREATDEEIKQFNKSENFNSLDDEEIKSLATSNLREKIFEIEKSGILVNLDKKKFQAYATLANLDITITKGKIDIPKNKADFKKFIALLCEDYYEGGLMNRTYLSVGKRIAGK